MIIYSPNKIIEVRDYMLKTQLFNVEFVQNNEIYSTAYNLESSPSKAEFIQYKNHPDLIVTNDICVRNTFSYKKNTNICFNTRVSNVLTDMITSSYDISNNYGTVGPFYTKWFGKKKPNWVEIIFKHYDRCDWMLVSNEIYTELKQNEFFKDTNINDYKGVITRVGYIYKDGILIYIYVGNIDDKDIYLGEVDSIRTKISNDIDVKSELDKDIITLNYRVFRGAKKIVKYTLK